MYAGIQNNRQLYNKQENLQAHQYPQSHTDEQRAFKQTDRLMDTSAGWQTGNMQAEKQKEWKGGQTHTGRQMGTSRV